MKTLLAGLLAGFLSVTSVFAGEWPIDQMNKTIEQTNFIVEDICSGTLISLEKKLILTNHHCIDQLISTVEKEEVSEDGKVKKVKVRKYKDAALSQYYYNGFEKVRSTSYVSEIVAESGEWDLAVVQIKGDIPNTQASPLAASLPLRGERVYTVGNPRMLEASVTEGVVMNVNRTFEFPWNNNNKTPIIQFSGGIIGGNSGGALYNSKGELVGVPEAMAGPFLGLAIPVTTVKTFLAHHCLMTANDEKCKADKLAAEEKKNGKKD